MHICFISVFPSQSLKVFFPTIHELHMQFWLLTAVCFTCFHFVFFDFSERVPRAKIVRIKAQKHTIKNNYSSCVVMSNSIRLLHCIKTVHFLILNKILFSNCFCFFNACPSLLWLRLDGESRFFLSGETFDFI